MFLTSINHTYLYVRHTLDTKLGNISTGVCHKKRELNEIFVVNGGQIRYNSNVSQSFVPWHVTEGMKDAEKVVMTAVSHTKENMPDLYSFLKDNCSHLFTIEDMQSHTTLPLIDQDSMKSSGTFFDLADQRIEKCSKQFAGKAGCYVFFDKETNLPVFIGSSVNLLTRAYNHTVELTRKDKSPVSFYLHVDKLGGFNHFNWGPIATLPNYTLLYTAQFGQPDTKTQSILELFTLFQARSMEQSYLAFYKPELNGNYIVSFGFKWYPNGAPRLLHDPAPTNVITKSGVVEEFGSTSKAAAYAGLDEAVIRARYNRDPQLWSFSKKLNEEVTFFRPGEPIISGKAKPQYKPLVGIDLLALPEYKTVLLGPDLQILGEFDTPKEAAESAGRLDIKRRVLTDYVNKQRSFTSPVFGFEVFLASNPNARSRAKSPNAKPVLIRDIKGLEPDLIKDSLADAAKHFGLAGGTGLHHKIGSPVPYKRRYLLTYVKP